MNGTDTSAPGRLIAIGDLHGCAHALEGLLAMIRPQPEDRLVFLGDLIDKGRETRETLDRLIALRQECHVVLIQGNHEELLYAARTNKEARKFWEACGGMEMLSSYHLGARLEEIPPEHWALLDTCVPYYETDEFLFTHANYLPDVPMSEQPDHQLRWTLFDPLEVRPHMSGKTVVVGHTEHPGGDIVDLGFAICIDTACWRYGWLTAIELPSRRLWQVSRWGIPREEDEGEEPQAGALSRLSAGGSQ